jgi:hypothetical protein
MKAGISFLGLLAILLAMPAYAEGIYQWEDENGQMHFSDMPHEGAIEIELQPVQTFTAPTVDRTGSKDRAESTDGGDKKGYKSLEITSPSNEENLWNTGGTVSVKMSVSPKLQSGDQIRLYMDGRLLEDQSGTSAQLSNVYRGAHILKAEVQDKNGRILVRSGQVTFFIKQQNADNALRAVPVNPNQNTKPQRSQQNIPRPTPRSGS